MGKNSERTLDDVTAAYRAVPEGGAVLIFEGNPPVEFDGVSHVQGIARWRGYTIIAHNARPRDRGYLIVFDNGSGRVLHQLETPFAGLDHPGGIQVCGDILAVAIENEANDKSKIGFFDLSPLPGKPVLIAGATIDEPGRGSGAVGLTTITHDGKRKLLLVAFDNKRAFFYLHTGTDLNAAGASWQAFYDKEIGDTDAVQLVTDKNDQAWLVVGMTEDLTHDYTRLFRLDLAADLVSSNLVDLDDRRHKITKHRADLAGLAVEAIFNPAHAVTQTIYTRVHFRFAFGVDVTSATTMDFLTTQGVFYQGQLISNVFRTRVGDSLPLDVLVHIEGLGDRSFREEELAGTTGKDARLEGFQIAFRAPVPDLGLEYMAHVQGVGDTAWVPAGSFVGTRGQSKRLEGFAIRLTGAAAGDYELTYAAHLQRTGTTLFVADGQFCGTRGESRRVEAIQIRLQKRPKRPAPLRKVPAKLPR